MEPQDNLEREEPRNTDPDDLTLVGRTYQSNTVNLYTDGKEICAMIGQ